MLFLPASRFATLADFAQATAPRVHVGETWLHFQAHPTLFGIVFWGRPGKDHIARLVDSLRLELAGGVSPHRSLVDASRLESVDGGGFEELTAYVAGEQAALSQAVTKLGLVRPSGMAGAVTSGFFEVTGAPYPVALFEAPAEALDWLGEDSMLGDELDQLTADITQTSPLRARLLAALTRDLRAASPAKMARALGFSERTLQRRLQGEGTTFATELSHARIAEAKRRMLDSDEPLSAVGLEVGFSSQQHFSSSFRDLVGQTPGQWRDRNRSPKP